MSAQQTGGSHPIHSRDVNFPLSPVYSISAFNYTGESVTSEHVGATTPVCGLLYMCDLPEVPYQDLRQAVMWFGENPDDVSVYFPGVTGSFNFLVY